MPIDLKEFINTFVEESLEMLQETEKILLNQKNTDDKNDINHLFRYMHSLKGGSAIFKLTTMTELTHTLETFLDQARSGKRQITQGDKESMLKAVDCLHAVVMNVKNKKPIDDNATKELTALFQQKIQHLTTIDASKETAVNNVATINAGQKTWEIDYHPHKNIFQKALEPMRLLQSLSKLGKTNVVLDIARLPSFSDFDPSECYLSWKITLQANANLNDILEITNWVADAEEVSIEIGQPALAKENARVSAHAVTTSIRVATDKIDHLMNIVGELIENQSVLTQVATHYDASKPENLYKGLASLEQTSRELQDSVLRIRMIPVAFIFTRFPRMMHDLSKQLNKEVELIIAGEKTELDKNMMEKLNDPLVHLIRNALSHGIELPEVREKRGKSRVGVLQLNAYQEGSNIVIDVTDDGGGLDKEKIRAKAIEKGLINENEEISDDKIYQLIFQPGFSTNESVSEISGRGVGLDVVYKNMSELGGDIEIETTKGIGTTFKLRLPLTLVIMDAQLVKVSTQTYIIPLISIVEITRLSMLDVNQLDLKSSLYFFRDEYIPLIDLAELVDVKSTVELQNKSLVIVSAANGELAALIVDELLSQQQVIIKNVEENYRKIPGIAGVTILGDGSVVLILDVKTIIRLSAHTNKNSTIIDSAPLELEALVNGNNDQADALDEASQILIFEIDGHEYGIDIKVVNEIRMWEATTHIPNAPSYIKGLINVRGSVIPIVDLNERFMLKSSVSTPKNMIISLMIQAQQKTRYVGVIVDKVLDTYPLHSRDIKPFPSNFQSAIKKYTTGVVTVENKMVALLNPKHLVFVSVEQESVQ